MEPFKKQQNLISSKSNKIKKIFNHKQDTILCRHCRRTSSNGIRCLGICVADNDY